jgi:membrane protease YdiL (CAAX protease family)
MKRPPSAQTPAFSRSALARGNDPQGPASLPGNISSERWLFIAYYFFGAIAWRALGAILGAGTAPAKGLIMGLVLSSLKAAIWLLPAVLLARTALGESVSHCLGVRAAGRPLQVGRGFAVAAAFLTLTTALQLMLGGPANWSAPSFPGLVLNVINALVEEISFRGFMLNRLAKRHPFWRANLIQSLLFLLVHWLGWLSGGAGFEIIPMSIALTTLALVLGSITRLTGSVWLAVAVHTINNFVASRFSPAG